MRTRARVFVFGLTALAACGAPSAREPMGGPAATEAPEAAAEAVAADWADREEEVLAALSAADPTVAARLGVSPSLTGPDAEVEADWLAPRRRANGVAEAERALSRWPDSARLPRTANGRAWQLRLERELVIRAVREERFRLEHEAELPRAASALVRAMVRAAAGAPATDPVRAHDRWRARRLEEVRAAVQTGGLDDAERAELEDALDDLERGATPAVTAALVRVRLAVEAAPRAPARPPDAARLEAALGAHGGTSMPLAVVRSRLERAEAALREGARALAARVPAEDARQAERDVEAALFRDAACGGRDAGSRLRRAYPPPERAGGCALVQRVATAHGEREALAAWLVLHDHVAVALWALARRATGSQPDPAVTSQRLLGAIAPEARARLARLAAVRATEAVLAGLAAEMLARRGPDDAGAVAAAWAAFGDAPLDIVEREVMAKAL